MANIKIGVCPSCGKERQLIFIKYGVIQSTMCPQCLLRYLDRCIIPTLQDTSDNTCMIGVNSDDDGKK